MKKLLSIIIIILITGVCLTGCAKKDTGSSKTLSDTAVSDKKEEYPPSYTEEKSSEATADMDNGYNISDYENFEAEESIMDGSETSVGSASIDEKAEMPYKYAGNIAYDGMSSDEYSEVNEVGFKHVNTNPLSTFSIDVDTASYSNLRKTINYGMIPDANAIRIEEMLNYFNYRYEEPEKDEPFRIHTEIGKCPWNEQNYLLMIGLQGRNVETEALPKSNLVFLIDVSGSMDEPDKLPLLKNAFSQLVRSLGENDKISIVVYAGEAGVVLDSVRGNEKELILNAINSLNAGGSTAGAGGINMAYQLAEKNFITDGNNRVILATDGDFNVGPSSMEELEKLIEEKRDSGIFLSVIGFGSGNLKDNRMELLADKGNGNYAYIDSSREAKKVLVDEMAGTLLTIAKDVKIQVEFNPYSVAEYRLIGYENRALQNKDFKDDTVDAGEIGAGHQVTAIYEIVPSDAIGKDGDLKYQTENKNSSQYNNEISEIRLRYKEPDGNVSKEIKQVVSYENTPVNSKKLSEDFYFAAAVAEFGMILRNSIYQGESSISSVLELAQKGMGEDEDGYRLEFIDLVYRYQNLDKISWWE